MFSLSWFMDGMDHKILKLLFFSFFTFLMLLSLNAISTARAALQWVLFVPSTPAPAAPCPGTWQGVARGGTWDRGALRGMYSPTPCPCSDANILSLWARRISPGCVLPKPPNSLGCQSKLWSLSFPNCLPPNPSISAAPECLHCPDGLPETGVCSGHRSSSLGIQVII